MTFMCMSPEECRKKYEQADDKREMIIVLSDLTCSTPKKMAAFLGTQWPIRKGGDLDEEKALRLFKAGRTDKQIALACDVHAYRIEQWRKENELSRVARRNYTDAQIEELYAQELSDVVIAEKLNIHPSSVRNWRCARGLPPFYKRRRKKKGTATV